MGIYNPSITFSVFELNVNYFMQLIVFNVTTLWTFYGQSL